MNKAIRNWWTTLVGVFGALGVYLTTVGTHMPTTKQEWTTFGIGLVMAVLGTVAKDGKTGSPPGATS